MSEKVKLTQEQAEAIESLKKEHLEMLKELYKNPENYDIGKLEPLMDLTAEQYHEALYIGYEVEPEFEAGDWIVNEYGSIGVIERMENGFCFGKWWNGSDVVPMSTFETTFERHATTKEKIIAKQRMWWFKHHREFYEIKPNDELFNKGCIKRLGRIVEEVNSVGDVRFRGNKGFTPLKTIRSEYHVRCFAEDRKDIE